MKRDSSSLPPHLSGEQSVVVARERPGGVDLDSFFGPVRVEWDHEAAMTPLGQLPFFIDFLKTSGLFDALVADYPLRYVSPNAAKKRDVLGRAMLSMLAGHKRYAHIAALRCDAVLPELLGMKKVVSEDAVGQAFKSVGEAEGAVWLRGHLGFCVEPLLAEPWILEVDTTIKPLYGHQEGGGSATIPRSPGVRAIAITPIRWPRRVLCSMSTSLPGTSMRPDAARRACGRSLIVCHETCGRRWCGATAASATRESCARRRRGGCPIFSSCA